MELIRFNIGDTVRVIGESRIGEITEIGFSDRMMERTYIVSYKDSKRKVLEHQLETAPVVFTIKDFDDAVKKVTLYYADEVVPQLSGCEDAVGQTIMNLVSHVMEDIKAALTGDDNAAAV